MSPIDKKFEEILNSKNITENTKETISELFTEVKELQIRMVDEAYFKGYTDKENGKSPSWNYFKSKYHSWFKDLKLK